MHSIVLLLADVGIFMKRPQVNTNFILFADFFFAFYSFML